MAYGSARRVAVPLDQAHPRPRRWIAAAVWGVCLVGCLAFWAAVGVAVWLLVT